MTNSATNMIMLLGLPTPGLAQLAETLGIPAVETAAIGRLSDQPLNAGNIFAGSAPHKPPKGNRDGNHLLYLMVYAAPADFLARQIGDSAGTPEASEESTLKALQFWHEYHHALLSRYRQTEATAILINGDRPISIDSLAKKLDNSARRRIRQVNVSAPLHDHTPPVDFPGSYLQIIDTLAPECLELYMDLESCAELMGREPEFEFSGPDQRQAQAHELLRLIAQQRQAEREYQTEIRSLQDHCTNFQSSASALAAEKASLQSEMESALLQMRRAQEELEQHRLACRTSDELLARTKAENAKLIAEREAEAKELQAENETLRQQLRKAQDELKQQTLATRKAEDSLAKTKADNTRLIAERDAEAARRAKEQHQAPSTPLNDKLSASESEKKVLQNENELLLLQLHQVQEELERYYLLHQKDEHDIEVLRKEGAARPEPFWKRLRNNGHEARTGFFGITASPLLIGGKLFGAAAKRKRAIRRAARVLRQSGAFDEQWYLQRYPDVAKAGFDPIVHYLKFGSSEGRNPSAGFDTRWYLNSNPDVVATGMNPLLHYVKFGKGEGRHPMKTRT